MEKNLFCFTRPRKCCFPIIFSFLLLMSCEKENISPDYSYLTGAPDKLLLHVQKGDDTLYTYHYNPDNRLIEKGFWYGGDKLYSENYVYDQTGRLIERVSPYEKEVYTYSEINKLSTRKIIYRENTANEHVRNEYFYYNRQGFLYLSKEYYDGRLVETHYYNHDEKGRIYRKISYIDEAKKNRFAELRVSYDDKNLPVRDYNMIPVEFGAANNLVVYYNYSAIMSSIPVNHYYKYFYDSDGFPVIKKEYFENSTDTILYSYIYEDVR